MWGGGAPPPPPPPPPMNAHNHMSVRERESVCVCTCMCGYARACALTAWLAHGRWSKHATTEYKKRSRCIERVYSGVRACVCAFVCVCEFACTCSHKGVGA